LLISLDGDHAFVDSITNEGNLLFDDIKVNLKSITLCFDRMAAPIDPLAIGVFLNLDAYALLTRWLKELQAYYHHTIGTVASPGKCSLLFLF
jgi:hypothetical protein